MQITVNSINIAKFGFSVTFDIANKRIIFDTSSLTTYNGSGISLVQGIAFSVIDQTGVALASINWAAPQIIPSTSQLWTLDLSGLDFPFLFQKYQIIGSIKDQDGTVYSTPAIYKDVCQPVDFTEAGYVPGMFQVTADCPGSLLTVKELTVLVYNNQKPVSTTKSGVLSYPTGTIAAINFTGTPFSNNVIWTGQYRVRCTTVGSYSLGDDVYVNITYYTDSVFDIICSKKMADLICCISSLQQVAVKECDNAKGQHAKQQLASISMWFLTGLTKEINGQDASTEAEYIRKTLNCNCGSTSIGQNEQDPVNPNVYNIVVVGVNGTTVAAPVTTGNTKTYTVSSNTYQVVKGDLSDLGFTIDVDTSTPGTVKYIITIDYTQVTSNILNTIGGNSTLLAQLQNLVNASAINLIGLDGKCVIDLAHVDYSLTKSIVSGSVNNTIITNIVINGTNYAAPTNLQAGDAVSVASWLNSLSLGTFSVTISGVLFVNILSLANTNVISTMTFVTDTPSGVVPDSTVQFTAFNKTLVQVLQAIINYLCNITAFQVALSQNLDLCTFDYNGNIITTTYNGSQAGFNTGVAAAICNLVGRIFTLSAVTCEKIQSIFQDSTASFANATDRILGIIGGACTSMTASQLATAIIAAINSDSAVKTAFCAIDCSVPGDCPEVFDFSLAPLSNTAVGIYGLTWAGKTFAAQTVTVKYRVTGTTTWVLATGSLGVQASGNLSGSTPYGITSLLPATQYDVFVINNCGGNGLLKQIVVPANTLYTGNFLLENFTYLLCGVTPVQLYSSVPFATGVTMYTDSGLTTPVTGFTFIANVADGEIFALNTSTGVVGADQAIACANGTSNSVILGNSTGTICAGSPSTVYTSGAFTVGSTLYIDLGLTTPVTGFTFVARLADNHIYNLNTSTGIVGADTGLSCSSNTVTITSSMAGMTLTAVTLPGFTPSPALPMTSGHTVVGSHSAFTGTIALTITGSLIINPSNISLYVNGGFVSCLSVTSAGTFTFGTRTYLTSDVIQIYLNTGSC